MNEAEDNAREIVRSRVTPTAFDAIERFVGVCSHWGRVSNLVSEADRARLWERHVLDSLQLVPLAEGAGRTWVDLGSGGGFPGLVVALAREGTDMTLIESNRKKCAFLLQAASVAGTRVRVISERIERVRPFTADVVSARALTALAPLLRLAAPFFGPHTVGLFPKGETAAVEIDAAAMEATFAAEPIASSTAKPTVSGTNRKWYTVVMPNCQRASIRGSITPPGLDVTVRERTKADSAGV